MGEEIIIGKKKFKGVKPRGRKVPLDEKSPLGTSSLYGGHRPFTGGHASLRGYEIKIGAFGELSRTEKTLVLIIGEKGYLACGYWNLETADKFGDCCAIITGVNTVEEMLEKKVVAVSKKAKEVGINIGMSGRQVLQVYSELSE